MSEALSSPTLDDGAMKGGGCEATLKLFLEGSFSLSRSRPDRLGLHEPGGGVARRHRIIECLLMRRRV